VQAQLQTLNNSFVALELSASDIQKVDQIAGARNNYDPTTFTSLAYQLEGLAQNASSQTAQTTAASVNAANAATCAT